LVVWILKDKHMEDATVQLILGRFDKLDEKLDRAIAKQGEQEVRLAKAEMVLADQKFKSRVLFASHAFAVAIGGVFMTVLHYFFPGVSIKR
jgi:hypothetical protein